MRLAARYAARSDIGRHRQTNEDSWLARPPLFAVADGMGGARAGEVASRVALETLADRSADVDPLDREAAGAALMAAAAEANQRVWQLSTEYAAQAGMGTTLTALALCADGARLAHIGDSRAYLLRDGVLRQLTDDHSLVGEMVRSGELPREHAAGHPLRSILSRALGTEPEPQIDLLDVDLLPGDVLLLCSDGLTGPVADPSIALILSEPDPDDAARRLIDAALREGGPDNITVVVVRLDEAPEGDALAAHAATAAAAGTAGAATAAAATTAGPDAAYGEPAVGTEGAFAESTATSAGPVTAGEVATIGGGQDGALPEGAAAGTAPQEALEATTPAGSPDGAAAEAAVPAQDEAPAASAGFDDVTLDTDPATEEPTVSMEFGEEVTPDTQPAEAPALPLEPAGEATLPMEAPEETTAPRERTADEVAPAADGRPYLGGAAAPATASAAAATAPATGRRTRRRWLTVLIVIAACLVVLAAAAGVVGQLEWVGVSDDGVVTVYRGVPFDFAGLRLYREHQRTAVPYAGLTEDQQAQVDAHSVGWSGSGEELAAELDGGAP